MKIKRMMYKPRIKLHQCHLEMEDNGLMICQRVFKMVELVNITGLVDQDQKIMIINIQIEFMRNLKL